LELIDKVELELLQEIKLRKTPNKTIFSFNTFILLINSYIIN
jgi:hypothetical protein